MEGLKYAIWKGRLSRERGNSPLCHPTVKCIGGCSDATETRLSSIMTMRIEAERAYAWNT
jgi:hypothetical protein